MEWILAALAIGVVGLAAAASTGRFGEMPDVVDDRVHPQVPDSGPLTGKDLRDIQFAVVPRGYSMEQVDALLERVATQIDLDETAQPVVANPGPRDLE
jgi:DivIVA domain-containing protein